MIRLAISVEGRTEEEFVKGVLVDHLRPLEVEPCPVVLGRARSGSAGGGDVRVERLVSDMVLLRRSFDAVTSLVDFYGFRGRGNLSVKALEDHLMQKIKPKIRDARRVFPYVQKHEFEGLLFSDTAAFRVTGRAAERDIEALSEIRRRFSTPEDINDDPEGAPSRRIARTLRGYRKRLHGWLVAQEVGLATIRAECPRFDAWLTRLEGLSRAA